VNVIRPRSDAGHRGLADDAALAALQGFAAIPRWLSAFMEPKRLETSLRRAVPELADGRLTLLDCVPQRLRAKGDQWLARCQVTVAGPDGFHRDVVLVGRVVPPTEDAPRAPTTQELRVAFGEPGWHCYVADIRLWLQVQTADVALPALPKLVDPVVAGQLLGQCVVGAGHRGVQVLGCTPQVVRYKPGSRCTIVYQMRYRWDVDGTDAADRMPLNPLVAKTHEGEKGRVAWQAMTALWGSPLARGDVVTVAEPLAYLPEERILVQGPVPGERTLKELARLALTDGSPDALTELRADLGKTARGLAALHQSGARYGRVATLAGELDEVREVVNRLSHTLPDVTAAAAPLLHRLEVLDAAVPADPLVSAHHDFRPAQVLINNGRVGFIDFDGAGMAEPALDLGRFRAKLRDIGVSTPAPGGRPMRGTSLAERLATVDELCEHFLAAYQDHATATPARVVLWEAVDLFTALLHAWTKVRLLRVGPRLTVLLDRLRSARLDTVPGIESAGAKGATPP
jgi:hypothetical protein